MAAMLSGEAVAILLKAVTLRAPAKRGKDPRFICAVPHSSAQRMVHHSVWPVMGRLGTVQGAPALCWRIKSV